MLPVIIWYSGKTNPQVNEPLCRCKVGKIDLGALIQFGQL